jgi:hypothetical protein
MRRSFLIAAAAACAGSGCIFTTPGDTVVAGDPLDARFLLTWTTNDVQSGTEIDCYSAGADTVRVTARNTGSGDVLINLFRCDAKTGETDALVAGDYSISIALVHCRGDAQCATPRVLSTLAARGLYGVWGDTDVDLGHFVFLVR